MLDAHTSLDESNGQRARKSEVAAPSSGRAPRKNQNPVARIYVLAAHGPVRVRLLRQHNEGRLDDTTTQAQHQVERRLLLDVVIRQRATVFELLPRKDQTLLIRRDTLLVLNLRLHVVDGVRGLHLQGDGLTRHCVREHHHPPARPHVQLLYTVEVPAPAAGETEGVHEPRLAISSSGRDDGELHRQLTVVHVALPAPRGVRLWNQRVAGQQRTRRHVHDVIAERVVPLRVPHRVVHVPEILLQSASVAVEPVDQHVQQLPRLALRLIAPARFEPVIVRAFRVAKAGVSAEFKRIVKLIPDFIRRSRRRRHRRGFLVSAREVVRGHRGYRSLEHNIHGRLCDDHHVRAEVVAPVEGVPE